MTYNVQRVAVVAVTVVIVLLATYDCAHGASVGHNRSPRAAMPPSCGCLADRIVGRLIVKDLTENNKLELLLLHHLLHQSFSDENEIEFAVDLVTGLLTFELMPKVAAFRHRRLALVIDLGAQLHSSSPLDRRSKAALIYLIDTQSKNVWSVGSEVFGSEFGDIRRRFEFNRCAMNAGKHHPIAKLGWLHYIRYRPISPLLLMLTGEMCKPVILADAIHLAFIRRLIDRTSNDSSILRDAVILRHYLHHQNQGIITDVSHVHHHVLIAAGLFFKLMFPEAPESGPVPCCSPSQWHGSAIKSEVFTIAGKSAAPQTIVMDNIAVDHDAHAIAGSYYNLLDGKPAYNTSFLMLSSTEDQTKSSVVYIVDVATATCVAMNFTGFNLQHKCLSEETANYTGQISLGDDQLELYGWSNDLSSANLRFQGTLQRYVSLIDNERVGRKHSTTSTCVPVFEFSDWTTKVESVSSVTLMKNIELSVAEGAFDIPPECANTEISYIPQSQLGDSLLTIQKFLATLGS